MKHRRRRSLCEEMGRELPLMEFHQNRVHLIQEGGIKKLAMLLQHTTAIIKKKKKINLSDNWHCGFQVH